jgi:hypothetical protein
MLHAWLTLAAAWITGSVAARYGGAIVGCAASVIVLGTPWTVITGSLAYNEMVVAMLLAAGLLLVEHDRLPAWRLGAALGVMAGVACGAKLTAVGFAAAPLAVLMLWRVPSRNWIAALASFALAAMLALAPWLIGNAIACGNPVFPFATGLFGSAHWSDEQVTIWKSGHSFQGGVSDRMNEAWTELLRYGLGPSPDPASSEIRSAERGEPGGAGPRPAGRHGSWQPQWSLLPWLALVGLVAGLVRADTRSRAASLGVVLLIQILFWLAVTHVKSRFMVPAAVPMALLVALPLTSSPRSIAAQGDSRTTVPGHRRATKPWHMLVIAVALVAWSSLPVLIFARERGGAPAQSVGFTSLFTGDDLSAEQQRSLAMVLPTVYINHMLPRGSRVLLIGDATPFYYMRPVSYQTTWDRGPMSRAIGAAPHDQASWFAQLRRDGFSHLLLNPTMLQIWSQSSWNDPMLSAETLVAAADRQARLVRTFDNGERLYAIDQAVGVTTP